MDSGCPCKCALRLLHFQDGGSEARIAGQCDATKIEARRKAGTVGMLQKESCAIPGWLKVVEKC